MPPRAFSQSQTVTRLVESIHAKFGRSSCQCCDADTGTDISVLISREMAPCHSTAQRLTEALYENGYLFSDHSYLASGIIHAKFDNEFNIWADTRVPVEPGQTLVVDFSCEFFIEPESMEWNRSHMHLEILFARMTCAISAFDSAVRESREDLAHMFSTAHPWDWQHRIRT